MEQIQKHAIYILAPHLQYKEAISKFNLPTIKDRLDILNSNFFKNIVDNDVTIAYQSLMQWWELYAQIVNMNLQNVIQIDLKPAFIPNALFNYQE